MINYEIIHLNQVYYEQKGFSIIETPWTVTESIARLTTPKDVALNKLIHNDNKVLVGSAEQGFLYLYNKGFLPKGKFQSVSPCYRADSFDETHTKNFIKNELIITDKVNDETLKELIKNAYDFYTKHTNKLINIVATEVGYDIEINGIEVGSYGIRECSFLKWIYGTGIAEPRFSRIMQ